MLHMSSVHFTQHLNTNYHVVSQTVLLSIGGASWRDTAIQCCSHLAMPFHLDTPLVFKISCISLQFVGLCLDQVLPRTIKTHANRSNTFSRACVFPFLDSHLNIVRCMRHLLFDRSTVHRKVLMSLFGKNETRGVVKVMSTCVDTTYSAFPHDLIGIQGSKAKIPKQDCFSVVSANLLDTKC